MQAKKEVSLQLGLIGDDELSESAKGSQAHVRQP